MWNLKLAYDFTYKIPAFRVIRCCCGTLGRRGAAFLIIYLLATNDLRPTMRVDGAGMGRSFKEFWPEYPAMSYVEKANKTRIEHQRIVDFGSRWNDVLKRLGLPEISASTQPKTKTAAASHRLPTTSPTGASSASAPAPMKAAHRSPTTASTS